MQKIIDAEKSDLFDVLAHVAYALPPLTREERAAKAKVEISTHFNSKQQVFLDFVLSHYVKVGVRGTGPGKADSAAPAQVPQRHRRRRRRPRQARRDREGLCGLSEVSVPTAGVSLNGLSVRFLPRSPTKSITYPILNGTFAVNTVGTFTGAHFYMAPSRPECGSIERCTYTRQHRESRLRIRFAVCVLSCG